MLKIDPELQKDVGEIKPIGIRLNVRMLVIAVVTLATVIIILFKMINSGNSQRISQCEQREGELTIQLVRREKENIQLRDRFDSLIVKGVRDKDETIHFIDSLIKNQIIMDKLSRKLNGNSK